MPCTWDAWVSGALFSYPLHEAGLVRMTLEAHTAVHDTSEHLGEASRRVAIERADSQTVL